DKALRRMTDLARREAIEQRLVDEEIKQYDAARASEHARQAGVKTAQAEYKEALAKVNQAKADLVAAEADVRVSEANLKKARVLFEYTRITSPYDGVVIFRGEAVHPGAFIAAATEGLGDPLLTIARDDMMRTIVPVPDRD